MDAGEHLLVVNIKDNGVAVITLFNPPLNLITLAISRKIIQTLLELDKDPSVRVLIITGQGEKAFSAGADIKEFIEVRDQVIEKKLMKENEAMDRIEFFCKPVIAAIEGVAFGGGCEISLACDIRIMSESAKIGLPEINLGVFPGSGGLFRLQRLVGPSKAFELMCLGQVLTAPEALEIGLINKITPKGMAYEVASEMAEQIAKKSTVAIQAIKKGVRESRLLLHSEVLKLNLELSDLVFKTSDCEEGANAFFEKRTPQFNK